MIVKRKLFSLPNEKFLGKEIDFSDGYSHFNEFNFKKLKNRAKLDDFYNAVLDYESNYSNYSPINKFNIKERLDVSVEWNDYGKKLYVTLLDKKSDFFWAFAFKSPDDEIEVLIAGD